MVLFIHGVGTVHNNMGVGLGGLMSSCCVCLLRDFLLIVSLMCCLVSLRSALCVFVFVADVCHFFKKRNVRMFGFVVVVETRAQG